MPTDAIVLLKDEHKQIRKSFRDFEKAGDAAYAAKGRIVDRAHPRGSHHPERVQPSVGQHGPHLVGRGLDRPRRARHLSSRRLDGTTYPEPVCPFTQA